jgi:decaprenyl-phosphate phosphoribosyltransferase
MAIVTAGTSPMKAPERRPSAVLGGLVKAARPRQWVKNVLVLAAPAAGGVLDEPDVLLRVGLAFVAFCLVSSATYILNDLGDVAADRQHPVKRDRPIAAGIIGTRVALVAVGVLLGAGLALAYVVSWKLGLLLTGYKLLTTAYTFRLKHTATVDVAVVATGFIVRAVAGGVAADIVLSEWFLAVTSFGSLFLVSGKRHGELLHATDSSTRPALAQYTLAHLQFLVSMTAAVTIVTYCLWAFEHPRTSDVPWWGLSIIPFVIGIMRYALLVDRGHGGAPEELILRDPGMRLVGVVWVALFLGSVYVH